MSTPPDQFRLWLQGLPKWHGWVQLSPERAYAHAEDQYDNQYGVVAAEPEDGEGLCNLLRRHACDLAGPALEIGCGTGRLTYGLARHYPGPDFLITDPSTAFLQIAEKHVGAPDQPSTRLSYGVLNADDVSVLPAEMFSLIAMRSTLHHILDVPRFIASCAKILRPGGALVLGAEPVESGYLLMGSIGFAIAPTLEAAGVTLATAWKKQLADLTDTVRFYCRRDVVKTTAEDKHLFREHELSDLGAKHGLHLRFLPNASFADFAPPYLPEFERFSVFFLDYLQFCMCFDAEFLDLIRQHLKPQLDYIDSCYPTHVGPTITGIFMLRKTSAPSPA